MNYRTLGRTHLNVSEIGFGCWAIGGSGYGLTRDEDSFLALETAWEQGVNFYDTADTYGHGHSERLLAKFLNNKPREKIIVASKGGWDFYHGGSRKNFEAGYLRFACEKSLERLGLDMIDVYQLHNPKPDLIESGECIVALEKLKKEGKIRFIGISIHREAEGMAAVRDGRVDTLQVVFNLIDQRMAKNLFQAARKAGVGIIVREPLACGILTEKYKTGHLFDKEDHRRRWNREKMELDQKKVDTVKRVLSSDRLSLAQASLEYALAYEEVSTVIPGAKTKTQVEMNLRAAGDPKLRSEEVYQLRDLYWREEIFRAGETL